MIFVGNSEELLKQNYDVFKAKPMDRDEEGQEIQNDEDILLRRSLDVEQAIRCFRISHDGRHVACGDWYGNIRIHSLDQPTLPEIKMIEAHENEVLTMDYTEQLDSKTNIIESNSDHSQGAYLLASGSRDSLVQIYDSKVDYEPVQIIEEHCNTVTAVRFYHETSICKKKESTQISIISGGADKQLVKHAFQEGQKINDLDPFKLQKKEQTKNKVFSMEVSAGSILTGHDRNLCLREASQLERIWEKQPNPERKVVPDHLKVMISDNAKVAVSSTTDKQVTLFDTQTGRVLCKAYCGELTTGIIFSENGKHLITTSSVGVIYVWRLPDEVTSLLRNQVKVSMLETINESELEDSKKGIEDSNNFKMKSANVKNELDGIFAQIGQVNGIV